MAKIIVKNLTKMEVRKLNALRKSLGRVIADKAFAEWLKTQKTATLLKEDTNAKLIEAAVVKLIKTKKLSIPQRGYLVTRGRGKVKVTALTRPAKRRRKAATSRTAPKTVKTARRQADGKKTRVKRAD